MRPFADLIADRLPELIEFRHDLHRHPEPGYEEFRTAERLLDALSTVEGLTLRTGVAETGIVATLNADREGRCVALRADMDALPIHETNTFAYRSRRDGWMHACGHDGHMTCLLGAARVLGACRDELPGKVKFIFQPAEEGGSGGRRMVEEGALHDPEVDAAFAMHGWPDVPLGSIQVGVGPVFGASSEFHIELVGRGAHAAFPHQGTDVILAASHLVTKLQSVASRLTDPVQPVVVSVCAIHAGDAFNVLPDRCTLVGTTRGLSQEVHDRATGHIRDLTGSTAAEFGLTAEVKVVKPYPSLVNDPAAAKLVRDAGCEMLGPKRANTPPAPTLGAEDFAFFARAVPSAFWLLGLGPPEGGAFPRLHQPTYDFPDAAIPIGVEMHCRVTRRFLVDGLPTATGT